MANATGLGVKRSAAGSGAQESISDEEIAGVAYELFERRGRSPGRDQQDWFEAERILRQRRRSRAAR